MGLDINGTRFLLHAHSAGVDFGRTAMIGRQEMQATVSELGANLARFGIANAEPEDLLATGYAEDFLALLGAHEVASFDASPYENASVVHDFNQPIPEEYKNRFTAVLDGGTLEHVFNYPTAIKNCMAMVAEGGHFLAITPTNNQMGHGFYQFSPELFYRVLSPDNGFEIERMMIFEEAPGSPWYDVADPDAVKERVTLINTQSSMLLVIARKVKTVEIFRKMPQQSDYAAAWSGGQSSQKQNPDRAGGVFPLSLLRKIRFNFERSRGWLNRKPRHFKKVDLP